MICCFQCDVFYGINNYLNCINSNVLYTELPGFIYILHSFLCRLQTLIIESYIKIESNPFLHIEESIEDQIISGNS